MYVVYGKRSESKSITNESETSNDGRHWHETSACSAQTNSNHLLWPLAPYIHLVSGSRGAPTGSQKSTRFSISLCCVLGWVSLVAELCLALLSIDYYCATQRPCWVSVSISVSICVWYKSGIRNANSNNEDDWQSWQRRFKAKWTVTHLVRN